jgi:hypothetical protein
VEIFARLEDLIHFPSVARLWDRIPLGRIDDAPFQRSLLGRTVVVMIIRSSGVPCWVGYEHHQTGCLQDQKTLLTAYILELQKLN